MMPNCAPGHKCHQLPLRSPRSGDPVRTHLQSRGNRGEQRQETTHLVHVHLAVGVTSKKATGLPSRPNPALVLTRAAVGFAVPPMPVNWLLRPGWLNVHGFITDGLMGWFLTAASLPHRSLTECKMTRTNSMNRRVRQEMLFGPAEQARTGPRSKGAPRKHGYTTF